MRSDTIEHRAHYDGTCKMVTKKIGPPSNIPYITEAFLREAFYTLYLLVVYSLLFLLRLKSIQSEFKVLFMVNITSYQSLGRIVKRGIAIDVGGRTGRRGINPVIYGFAVLNIDRLHLRDENFVFICLFPIAKTMHAL